MIAVLRGARLKQLLDVKEPAIDDEILALLTAARRTGLIHGGRNSAKISAGEGAQRSYLYKHTRGSVMICELGDIWQRRASPAPSPALVEWDGRAVSCPRPSDCFLCAREQPVLENVSAISQRIFFKDTYCDDTCHPVSSAPEKIWHSGVNTWQKQQHRLKFRQE